MPGTIAPDPADGNEAFGIQIPYPTYSAANLHYGKLGRLVGEQMGWTPLPKQTVFVLVTFEKPIISVRRSRNEEKERYEG